MHYISHMHILYIVDISQQNAQYISTSSYIISQGWVRKQYQATKNEHIDTGLGAKFHFRIPNPSEHPVLLVRKQFRTHHCIDRRTPAKT
jgi:hypothetical protein